jgi:membrane fusion protein, multidrug efflux system
MKRQSWVGSIALLAVLAATGVGLAFWKIGSIRKSNAAAAAQPEPMEVVEVAIAREHEHQRTTTTVGTVLALRSVTLRNELAGTVREAALTPGQIVEEGSVLVALDVSVEQAELDAQQAQATLTETALSRAHKLEQKNVAADSELDRARADRDVALAQMARTKAIIEKKTIRAPFRARVGMADLHPGQYLNEGTQLTTLQGVDDAVHVDFSVPQRVAATLGNGAAVDVLVGNPAPPIPAKIVAVDSRVDPSTRNAWIRAKIEGNPNAPSPGASVMVRVPIGKPVQAVSVPVSALRKGPEGDHVYIIAPGQDGKSRAQLRRVQGGTMIGDEVLVVEGLKAGEQVAAAGSFKLREMAPVVIAPPKEAKPTAGVR